MWTSYIIIYNKPNNESFSKIIENIQSRAFLAITGVLQGPSLEELYEELELKSLSDRRWSRKLVSFYKIFNTLLPLYPIDNGKSLR